MFVLGGNKPSERQKRISSWIEFITDISNIFMILLCLVMVLITTSAFLGWLGLIPTILGYLFVVTVERVLKTLHGVLAMTLYKVQMQDAESERIAFEELIRKEKPIYPADEHYIDRSNVGNA